MNILPKNPSQFLDRQYWDRFFAKLKSSKKDEFFQWYGSYADHKPLLDKLVPEKSHILNIGCGKSLFAEDMVLSGKIYDILSCDYSEQVVADMQARSDKKQLPLKYKVADVFDLKYKPDQFDIVFDKGTLDAIFPQDTQENVARLREKFFPSIMNILAKINGSKYIIISLLQPHIVRLLFDFFGKQPNYNIHVYESRIADSKMQPFLISVEYTSESKKNSNVYLHPQEINAKPYELTPKSCEQSIIRMHAQMQMGGKIGKLTQGQAISLEILGQDRQARFGLEVLDSTTQKLIQKNSCVVFIVPQGKERVFLYGTQKGLKMLHQQVPCSRLIVVKLISGNEFGSFEAVKQELNPAIRELLPKGCNPTDVPYVTDGDELGERSYLYRDKDHIIEEVHIDDSYYRRLLITSNIGLVQSQFRLNYYNSNNSNKQYLKDVNAKLNPLPPKKNGTLIGIDDEYLEQEGYEQATIAGISLMDQKVAEQARVLVLGGGACVIPRYLYNHFKHMDITVVEIDGRIIELAEQYFELRQDDRFRVVQSDALKFIFQAAQKPDLYDLIIFDINGGVDGQPSPSPIFVSKDFLARLQKCLTKSGELIFHLINRQPLPVFQEYFNPIYIHTDEIVTMLYCFNEPLQKRVDANKKELIVVKAESQEVPRKGRFPFEEEILGKVKVHWPRVGGVFNGIQVYIENDDGELVNSSKNMYKSDLEKVNKKKNKRKS